MPVTPVVIKPSTSKPVSQLANYLSDIYNDEKRPRLEDELEDYLSSARESSGNNFDMLNYWRQQQTCYPCLCAMARDYLSISATSASSERVFSTGRDLLGICRHSLKPSTMEVCICLRSWMRAGVIGKKPANAAHDSCEDLADDDDETDFSDM